MLKPKLFTTLSEYSWTQLGKDLLAGVIVGIVAFPLAIAFAIASGVSPERGLTTAIVAGFLISVLGGSRVQIGGPTGAFVVIVYGVVSKYGLEGLWLATMMAGVMLIVMGVAGFGSMIKFIPYPVTVGFTSGIALIIFISQIKDFFGLDMAALPAEFLAKLTAYYEHVGSVNGHALAVSVLCVGTILLWKKIPFRLFRFIPGPLVALMGATVLVYVLHWPVETIGSRFGEIPHAFPAPKIPLMSVKLLQELTPAAISIALLAGIESLLSAVVADGMIGSRHRSNMELVAQGVANIFSPLFGGIPATGAIARTATNIQNGGRTPIAGIVHAAMLLLLMLFFGQWVKFIPLAALAAILVIVAYNMSEWNSFLMVLRSPKSDVLVLLTTFFLTVAVDLTVALQAGIVLSAFLFMRRMALVANVGVITREMRDGEEVDRSLRIAKDALPPGVEIYDINGPFFFGAAYKFLEAMRISGKKPKVRIVDLAGVPAIDATALHAIKEQCRQSKKQGVAYIISGIHTQPFMAMEQSGLIEEIGENNVFRDITEALPRARELTGA